MKNTFIIIAILSLLISLTGCENVTVGYLQAENATYTPDSLVIKAVLDPVEDKYQIENEIPFQSIAISGVQGTFPIYYTLKDVHCNNGYANAKGQFGMVQKGKIEIPWNHTLPVGRYIVDVEISNEGYTHVVDSAFTVIVK